MIWKIISVRYPAALSGTETFHIQYRGYAQDKPVLTLGFGFHDSWYGWYLQNQCRFDLVFPTTENEEIWLKFIEGCKPIRQQLEQSPGNARRNGLMKDAIEVYSNIKSIHMRAHDKPIQQNFIDLIHRILPFQPEILDDIHRAIGYQGTLSYNREMMQLIDSSHYKEALELAQRKLRLRGHADYSYEESPLIKVAEYCEEKQLMELALKFYQLVSTEQNSHWKIAEFYWAQYQQALSESLRENKDIAQACDHLQKAIENFMAIKNNRGSQLYHLSLKRLSEALEQIFWFRGMQKIELDEHKMLEYKELRFCYLMESKSYAKNKETQDKIDRAYDELRGNNGYKPTIKNVKGNIETLLALAKEARELRAENKMLRDQQQQQQPQDEKPQADAGQPNGSPRMFGV